MEELPEKVIQLDHIRLERGFSKTCMCETKKFTMDLTNRRITCSGCGAPVDLFDAMLRIAQDWEQINKDIKRIFEQKKALENYKPHLPIIKELEKKSRPGSSKMYPICPNCEEPFMLEELIQFFSAKFVSGRIEERTKRNATQEKQEI